MNRIKIIILSLLITLPAAAQKAVVERMEMDPFDLSGKKFQRLDLNGDPCALVKVQVIADGVQFFGNVIPDGAEQRVGEYWVYMVAGSKELRVQSPVFLPLKLYFPDYGIASLDPSHTYVVTLSLPFLTATVEKPQNKPQEKPKETATITVSPPLAQKNTVTAPAEDVNAGSVASETAATDWLSENFSYKSFTKKKKYGYKDRNTGKVVIKPVYDFAQPFFFNDISGKTLAYVSVGGKYGYIDKDGNMVIEPQFDGADGFENGLARVLIDGKHGFIDKTGSLVIPARYDDAGSFGYKVGLAPVKFKGEWMMIDKSGNVAIPPAGYERMFSFSEGIAKVRINGKYGFIDEKGNLVIPAVYDEATDFLSDISYVSRDGRKFYIDKSGNEVKR